MLTKLVFLLKEITVTSKLEDFYLLKINLPKLHNNFEIFAVLVFTYTCKLFGQMIKNFFLISMFLAEFLCKVVSGFDCKMSYIEESKLK